VTEAPRPTPGALTRYRVMAIVTGSLLLLVFLGMLRYIDALGVPDSWDPFFFTLAQVHGVVYMIYLVTVMQLWLQARWGYGRLAAMFFGGIVPLLSFFVERRITHELRPELEEAK
jgi:integral membrane protein